MHRRGVGSAGLIGFTESLLFYGFTVHLVSAPFFFACKKVECRTCGEGASPLATTSPLSTGPLLATDDHSLSSMSALANNRISAAVVVNPGVIRMHGPHAEPLRTRVNRL